MIELLDKADKEIFLFLNGFHNEFFDKLMVWVTTQETWYPFYAVILIYMIWKYRGKVLLPILILVLVITFSDQITSSVMKPVFERLRPCHNPEIQQLVHTVEGCGGQYGFASGHSANSFALATLLFLFFRVESQYWAFMFLWATIIAYSRVYLGVHYPGDIIAGGMVGMLAGLAGYRLYIKLPPRFRIPARL